MTLHLTETASVAGGPYDVDPTADAGTPAPAGMFSLSAETVTVPAHGTATVTATAQPSLGATGRRYLGQITATDTASAVVARTEFGLYKEDERYTLHVSMKDRPGNPAAGTVELQQFGNPDVSLRAGRRQRQARPAAAAGHLQRRDLRRRARCHGPDSLGLALLGNPQIDLDHDRTLDLDARKAVEVTAQVPRTTEDGCCSWTGTAPTATTASSATSTCCRRCTTACTRCRLARSPRAASSSRPAGARRTRC